VQQPYLAESAAVAAPTPQALAESYLNESGASDLSGV